MATAPGPARGGAGSPARFDVVVPPPADGSTRARLGRLQLTHGVVETPQFMPVGTNATVKALSPDDLRDAGATIILGNTYHLYLRPGHERIARLGGLHRFMAWDRPILTDSGGFQVVSLGELRKIDDDGVTFQSHLDGSYHRFTPEHSIAVQEALGSDIAVAFDQPVPPASSSRNAVAEATARTHVWAERSLAAHARPDQALFGIVQGGLDPALRRESTRFMAALPFDGICIGGLAGDETQAQRQATLEVVVDLLHEDPRPRYLMGLGSPADLLEAVNAGVDMFDSVLPARVARNGQLWIPGGKINIRNARFQDDPRPVQEGCRCLLCREFSRAYLAHLFRAEELLAYRLATCHNMTFTLDFMAEIRAALRTGDFQSRLPELRALAYPSKAGEVAVQPEISAHRYPLARGGTPHGEPRPPASRRKEEAQGRGQEEPGDPADAGAADQRGSLEAEAQAARRRGGQLARGRTPPGPRPLSTVRRGEAQADRAPQGAQADACKPRSGGPTTASAD